jgi:hypothetical protein
MKQEMATLRSVSTDSRTISRTRFRPRKLVFPPSPRRPAVEEACQLMTRLTDHFEQLCTGSTTAVSLPHQPQKTTASVGLVTTSHDSSRALAVYRSRRWICPGTSTSGPQPASSQTNQHSMGAAPSPAGWSFSEPERPPLQEHSRPEKGMFAEYPPVKPHSRKESVPPETPRKARSMSPTFQMEQDLDDKEPVSSATPSAKSLKGLRAFRKSLTDWMTNRTTFQDYSADLERFERSYREEQAAAAHRRDALALDEAIAGMNSVQLDTDSIAEE